MASFPATARLVRDESLSPQLRRVRLGNCLHHFAPFGFKATWNYLSVTHRVPVRVEVDPASLVRALDDLETTRALVLPGAAAFAARRRALKRQGHRFPAGLHPWNSRGFCGLAYCPDPQKYPADPLPVVVSRVLASYAAGVDPAGRCFVCGGEDRRPRRACRHCGVLPGGPGGRV
ncbi:hypothetical protein [Actinoplanes solisilvae]|uniref:hypothetical protein n=1 Tax=Actinoplanes solisilvae TaxID=2486853 RepID=UPI000FDAE840|nr:hypothetical protein [Actinoplanes solisilvae]